MVDEFSAFARMPKPVMERHDVRDVVREAVFLFQVSRPEIAFELDLPDKPVVALSTAACSPRPSPTSSRTPAKRSRPRSRPTAARAGKGRIVTMVRRKGDRVQIEVIDNGCGLPKENRAAPARALRDHQRQGHRPRPRHRAEDHRAAWRHAARSTMRRSATARSKGRRCASTCRSETEEAARRSGARAERRAGCEPSRARRGGRGSDPWRLTS